MSIQLKKLANSLPFVASLLGKKHGVKVVLNASKACTNGSTIYLPPLPENDDKAMICGRGFIDHESAHIRHTDFDLLQNANFNPFQQRLWNIIEDIVIEKKFSVEYPGVRTNLKKLSAYVSDLGWFSLPDEGELEPIRVFRAWLLSRGRYLILKQEGVKGAYLDNLEVALEVFGKNFLDEMAVYADMIEDTQSTREAIDLAFLFYSKIEDWIKKQEDPPKDPSNSDQSDGSGSDDDDTDGDDTDGSGSDDDDTDSDDTDGSGSDDDDTDSDDTDGSGSDDDDTDGDDTDGSGSDDDDTDGDDTDGSGSDDDDTDSDDTDGSGSDDDDTDSDDTDGSGTKAKKLQAVKKLLEDNAQDDDSDTDLGKILSELLEKLSDMDSDDCDDKIVFAEENTYAGICGDIDLDEVRQVSAKLRKRLLGVIQAKRMKSTFPKRNGRRVEKRKLHRASLGDGRIFKKNALKDGVNTAVMILLDRSSSMGTGEYKDNKKITRMSIARKATLSCVLGLESIDRVSVAAAAFPYVRSEGVVSLTRFNESSKTTYKKYGLPHKGNTPLREALWWSAQQLLEQPEERKILIVAHDGDPDEKAATKKAIERLSKAGIECIGVGIQTERVKDYFPDYCVVNNLADLPQQLFKVLQNKIY